MNATKPNSKFEEAITLFDSFKHTNGIEYWMASDLMKLLGYKDMHAFVFALHHAMEICVLLHISVHENFLPETRRVKGKHTNDYKLTRFACYLIVINADSNKQNTQAIRQYFKSEMHRFESSLQRHLDTERITARKEIAEGIKRLNKTARRWGVHDFSRFTNAGYRGLYNANLPELLEHRGLPADANMTDYMGGFELAMNLFRITQTNEKIKQQRIEGQYDLENAHFEVGRDLRHFVEHHSSTLPEYFPLRPTIKDLKQTLKADYKTLSTP